MTDASRTPADPDLPEGFTPHDGGMGYRDHILPRDWIEPIYRGPEDPAKGIRRAYGVAMAFNWTHDGGDDDIVGYRRATWQEGQPS